MAKTNVGENNGLGNQGKALVPPHNVHLARKLNIVKCRVDLYKIPPKCIKFEPTSTHLYVDTFNFTKKYCLNVPYPEGVTVDTNVEATFDSGVLKCDFPILADPNKPADHDKVVEARELVKEMRKNGVPIPADIAEAAKLAKTKAHPSETEEPTEKSSTTPPKKSKKSLSNKEKRQKEKAKRALENDGELDDPTTARKKKKAKVDTKPKKKTFMNDASQALKVADQVNDEQEKAYQDKLDKEYDKLSVDTRKRIERKEKKAQIRAMRKEEVEKAIDKFPKKDKKKKSATKVSFDQ